MGNIPVLYTNAVINHKMTNVSGDLNIDQRSSRVQLHDVVYCYVVL